jgi:hypothetical protein
MKELLIVVACMIGAVCLSRTLSQSSAVQAEELREAKIEQARQQSPTAMGLFLGSITTE